MQYREVGKTGIKGSIIGLGCEHLDGKPYEQIADTISAALEGGINMMDVFMPGREVRENIARALGNRRKDVHIQGHIGSTDIYKQYDISRDLPTVKRYFEDILRIFGYIDFGMMFFIDSEEDYRGVFETDFVKYVQERKAQGDIRAIGFSSHNPRMAPSVFITVTPFTQPMTVAQCIHYALTRPAVASVMLGCQTGDEVRDALQYLEMDDAARDYTPVLGTLRNDFRGNCVYCSHCQPCPMGIDIAAVNKYLDIAKLDEANVPPSVRAHYDALSAKGSDCIACGICEARCPFDVPIIERMQQAAAMFEQK